MIGSQAVNRDNSRMLEVAGNFGFGDEPLAANLVLGVLGLNLLECNAAMQLAVLGNVDFPQPPFACARST
jgi:hypothetical protein